MREEDLGVEMREWKRNKEGRKNKDETEERQRFRMVLHLISYPPIHLFTHQTIPANSTTLTPTQELTDTPHRVLTSHQPFQP